MKWYNKTLEKKFLIDLGLTLKKLGNSRDVLQFSKLAFKFVRQTGMEESKIGVLDKNDITQAAFSGLIEGWENVNWEKIEQSNEPMKTLVNYLSSYIDRQIKREVYRDATGVATPEYLITRTKKELAVDALFGNWMFKFKLDDFAGNHVIRFSQLLEYDNSPSKSWDNEQLNELLTTEMFKILSDKEREILRLNFGIDGDKVSMKVIAKELNMSEIGVKRAKARALDKLREYSDEKIFEDFL